VPREAVCGLGRRRQAQGSHHRGAARRAGRQSRRARRDRPGLSTIERARRRGHRRAWAAAARDPDDDDVFRRRGAQLGATGCRACVAPLVRIAVTQGTQAGARDGRALSSKPHSPRWNGNRTARGVLAACLGLAALATVAAQNREVAWTATGRDVHGTRYLPATEINRDNVARLAPAWTYRTRETEPQFATDGEASLETTPIVVDGVMYVGTPLGRVIALDAENGRELWVFDPNIARDVPYGDFANRGVATWRDDAASDMPTCQRRIFIANAQSELYALDARRGRPCTDFGANGKVDLKQGLRVQPFERQAYSMTSPPIVVGDTVIVGSSIADNTLPNPASGEVRAYDARRGRLLWSWDAIPQDASDPAYGEWRGDAAHDGGGANAWSGLAADAERDLVFVPTGSAAPDYYGGLRLGDNRYANSLVALRASTGKLVWSFQ